MSNLVAAFQEAITSVVSELGTEVSLKRRASTTFEDTDHPTKGYATLVGEDDPVEYTFTAMVQSIRDELIDGVNFQIGDKLVHFSTEDVSFVPVLSDVFVDEQGCGIEYSIVAIHVNKIEETDVSYTLHVRG